jgi:integrase/recombinase XerD
VKSFEEEFEDWQGHFDHYRSILKQRHKTLKPQKIYSRVEKFWTWLHDNQILPSDLKRDHFLRYASDLKSGALCLETEQYSKQSLVIFLNHALAWVRYLYKADIFLSDPFEGLTTGHSFQAGYKPSLTVEEVRQILQAPDLTVPWGLRNQAILEVIYGSGLRIGETASLTLQSVDLADRFLSLRNTKNGWDRSIPITRPAADSLQRYIQQARPKLQGPRTGNALWLSYHHEILTKDTLTSLAAKYSEQTGIKFTMHGLRHTCATHLLEGGAGLRHIAELLGHENIESTAYYAQARIRELQRVHSETHPRDAQDLKSWARSSHGETSAGA